SDPAKCGGFFVMVNLTKNVNRAGKDCELNIGDHQWVDQKCYVNFADALEITPIQEKMINQLIASKAITMHFPIDCFALGLLDSELSVFMQQLQAQGSAGEPGLA